MLNPDSERLLDELRLLSPELEMRVRRHLMALANANQGLREANRLLETAALTDSLTGLPNRRAMMAVLEGELRRRVRYPSPLAVGLIDVDGFKGVNDRYLWPGGDQVLSGLAQTFKCSLRAADTVGRFGGDEFILVAPETALEGARILAERLRAAVQSSQHSYNGQTVTVTISLGVVVAEARGSTDGDAIRHAAAVALSQAKASGGNRGVVVSLVRGEPGHPSPE